MTWNLYLACSIILSCCYFASTFPSRSNCPPVCECHGYTAVCGERDFGLTKIPNLPANIKHFIFLNGNIPLLNRKVLSPVSKCSLQSMSLRFDNITRLASDAFTDFTLLQRLDLSGNAIPPELLKNAFWPLGKRLETIVLRDMDIADLSLGLFADLKDHLRNVDLSANKLKHVFDNESLLEALSVLTKLNISHNQISFFSSSNANLRDLNINNNLLKEVPDFCLSKGYARYRSLVMVDMEKNGLQSLDNTSFTCLDSVKYLFLGHNQINILKNNTFRNMRNLNVLQLNHINITEIEELAFCSMSLLDLSFSDNKRLTNYTFSGRLPFNCAPKLFTLNLQNTHLDMLPASLLNEMCAQLKAIKKLNLQNTKLKELPASFSEMNTLTTLILATNHLESWNSTTFANLTRLKYLNLNNNRIRLVNETSFPAEMRSSLEKVNLGENEFLCTCALQWFRTWMNEVIQNKSIEFVKYPQSYWCAAPKRLRLDRFNPTYAECHARQSYVYVFVIAIVAAFVVLLVVVVITVYRCRWRIRYFFYVRHKYQRLPGRRSQFQYDAFVVYASEDLAWVLDEVVEFLENDHSFRLCMFRRDFIPGRLIVENISDNLTKSKKVILIVSSSFVNSTWCVFETKLAQQMDKQIIVINYHNNMQNYVANVLKIRETRQRIVYEHGREIFRQRLLNEMHPEEEEEEEEED